MAMSEALKRAQKKYMQSEQGKTTAKLAKQRYRQTEKGKRVHASSLLKQRYGITLDDKERMYQEQKGLCGFCDQPLSENITESHVDHSHKTGKVRKLVHPRCNALLGWAERNFDRIVVYLTGS
jgi:hypothetical protein